MTDQRRAPRLDRRLELGDEPHHDGSAMYATTGPHALGDVVRLRLRVPAAAAAERVRVRSVPDAEPLLTEATVERRDGEVTWWSADLPLHNPLTNYRFLLEGGAVGYGWLNEAVFTHRDVSDSHDFRIAVGSTGPAWLDETVGYQIFIDRFAASGTPRAAPDWAVPAPWEAPLDADPDVGTRQWFGGDLLGIEQHLDHLARVGVNLIYLTPFFPATSTHRYDASSFDRVDPLLGGDDALASLIAAAHLRGMRVLGDITLNHTGDRHEWFVRAQHDLESFEAGFYLFGDTPDRYVSWHDVPSLPKLDHRSTQLADRLYRGPDSVVARYLDAPFGLDGWRVDCANTTGRHADVDGTHRVAAETRATIESHPATDGTTGWLLAEHCFDAAADLRGDGWHGVMAYQWFGRPIWAWLRGDRPFSLMSQTDLPLLTGRDVVDSMRELGGTVAWAARQASMTMLDSHDTARFRTLVNGDRRRHTAGLVALFTLPGVPTLFAGSEVGVEGDTMDTCRVPFPWDEADWDAELLAVVTCLTRIRAEQPALRHGGLRWIDADDHTITFVRETPDDVVVVHLRRSTVAAVEIDIDRLLATRPGSRVGAPVQLFGAESRVTDSGSSGQVSLRFEAGVASSIVCFSTTSPAPFVDHEM